MTKEDIEKKLEEFRTLRKTTQHKKLDDLCKECGFKKLTRRRKTIWGKRNPNSENYHWNSINLEEYTPDKPTVVCLSGNGTKNEAEANGFCKRAERMLELLFKDKNPNLKPEDKVDIISCAYGCDIKYLFCPDSEEFRKMYLNANEYAKDFPEAIQSAYGNNNLSDKEIQLFVESVMLSRCCDREGKRLPIDECCRRISQVTFFTYCYGAQALNKIMETLEKNLLIKGFYKEEVEQIKSSMSHISFARKDYTRTIPSIFFYAVNDFDIGSINALRNRMLNTHCKLETRLSNAGEKAFGQELAVERFGDIDTSKALEFAYMAFEEKKDFVGQDVDHYVANIDRDKSWDIINKKIPIYDAISQMMSWALCRAVENGLQNAKSDKYIPKMSMEALQEELMSIYKSFSHEDSMIKE